MSLDQPIQVCVVNPHSHDALRLPSMICLNGLAEVAVVAPDSRAHPIGPSVICSSVIAGSQRGWLRTCSTAYQRHTARRFVNRRRFGDLQTNAAL